MEIFGKINYENISTIIIFTVYKYHWVHANVAGQAPDSKIKWPVDRPIKGSMSKRENELYWEMPIAHVNMPGEQGMIKIQIKLLDWKPFPSHHIANKHHIVNFECILLFDIYNELK